MEPVSKYITIQKKRVHYIAAGSSEKLGVIFLHGARFSAKDWLSVGSLTFLAREGYGAYALTFLVLENQNESASCRSTL